MLLSVDKYQSDIDEREKRIACARRFEEPDRVPVTLGIGGSYFCWLQGVNIRDYYRTPELQVEVQLNGAEWEYEYLKADNCVRQSIAFDSGPVGEAIVFGADVEWPDNTSPRIVHCCDTLDDVLKLTVPAPEDNPRLKALVKQREAFCSAARKMGVKLHYDASPAIGVHPPLSCVCALMDPTQVYLAMYTEPDKLKRAMDLMYEAFVTYYDHSRRANGAPLTGMGFGLADDNISQISGEMFEQFEMPYYLKFRERYQPATFSLHTDGPNDQHFTRLADVVKLDNMDIGGFSTLDAAVRDMKGKVYIHGGLNCKDFYTPGPITDATRRRVLRAIRLAAPGGGFELAIGGETYVRVSPEGIRDLVDLVAQRGRYPIDIGADEVG